MGNWVLGLLIIAGFAAIAGLLLMVLKKKESGETSGADISRMAMDFQKELAALQTTVQSQIQGLSAQVTEQLAQNSQFLIKNHEGYRTAVGQVENRLGELQQATRSMLDIGKDISSLQDILRSPKLRGGLGELFLAELLRQILPEDHFALQYSFRNGTKVDAVIFLGQGIIPVDAKFPLENFKRILEAKGDEDVKAARKSFAQDVKKHVDSIASKYILPEEQTFEFALMYIPAENVYYETIIKDELFPESLASYAQKKKVIPVSPNSFYAYLEAIVRGLKGLRIERSAQIILESLGQLETDFKKLMIDFEKVGSHLSNAQSSYERSLKGFEKLETKLASLENQKPKALPSEDKALQE